MGQALLQFGRPGLALLVWSTQGAGAQEGEHKEPERRASGQGPVPEDIAVSDERGGDERTRGRP